MLRPFTVAALAAIAVLMMAPGVGAGVMELDPVLTSASEQWRQVVATGGSGGDINAIAYHGFIEGNDIGQGDPLLRYLNSGTYDAVSNPFKSGKKAGIETLELLPGGHQFPGGVSDFTISNEGMFGSTKRGSLTGHGTIIDVVSYQGGFGGFNHPNAWVFKGDSGATGLANPFINPTTLSNQGVLTLNTALTGGSYVLGLKSSNEFSVFLFRNVDKISSFKYVTGNGHALSHASLFWVGPGTGVDPLGGVVPEPTSLAVFGIGALLGVGGSFRRRFAARK